MKTVKKIHTNNFFDYSRKYNKERRNLHIHDTVKVKGTILVVMVSLKPVLLKINN